MVRVCVRVTLSAASLFLPFSLTHSLTHMSVQPPCIQIGWTPVTLACNNGHRDCAELLLTRKADPERQSQVTWGEVWEVVPIVVGADACIIWCYGCGVVAWILNLGE